MKHYYEFFAYAREGKIQDKKNFLLARIEHVAVHACVNETLEYIKTHPEVIARSLRENMAISTLIIWPCVEFDRSMPAKDETLKSVTVYCPVHSGTIYFVDVKIETDNYTYWGRVDDIAAMRKESPAEFADSFKQLVI